MTQKFWLISDEAVKRVCQLLYGDILPENIEDQLTKELYKTDAVPDGFTNDMRAEEFYEWRLNLLYQLVKNDNWRFTMRTTKMLEALIDEIKMTKCQRQIAVLCTMTTAYNVMNKFCELLLENNLGDFSITYQKTVTVILQDELKVSVRFLSPAVLDHRTTPKYDKVFIDHTYWEYEIVYLVEKHKELMKLLGGE